MPPMLGILISKIIAANSCRSMASSASSAECARTSAAPARGEHDLERVQIPRLVVDDENLDVLAHAISPVQRYSHTRRSDSNWSVFTGLAM